MCKYDSDNILRTELWGLTESLHISDSLYRYLKSQVFRCRRFKFPQQHMLSERIQALQVRRFALRTLTVLVEENGALQWVDIIWQYTNLFQWQLLARHRKARPEELITIFLFWSCSKFFLSRSIFLQLSRCVNMSFEWGRSFKYQVAPKQLRKLFQVRNIYTRILYIADSKILVSTYAWT